MGFSHLHMKSKTQNFLNIKLLLFAIFFGFLILFIVRSSLSPSSNPLPKPTSKTIQEEDGIQPSRPASCPTTPAEPCNKIPAALAQALIHYSTSNITPQQTFKEISVTSRVLERKSPCKFLVFGLGRDSLMWSSLNYGGRTVFLEEDKAWIEQLTSRFPSLETYHVEYDTKVSGADELMKQSKEAACRAVVDPRFSECPLKLKGVPSEVYEEEWDLIMVDAPTGYFEGAPGRMGAIWTAGMVARSRKEGDTDVFVHDVNREVEDKFSRELLCEGYMREQEGLLRHFNIPSHSVDSSSSSSKPFCPGQ